MKVRGEKGREKEENSIRQNLRGAGLAAMLVYGRGGEWVAEDSSCHVRFGTPAGLLGLGGNANRDSTDRSEVAPQQGSNS